MEAIIFGNRKSFRSVLEHVTALFLLGTIYTYLWTFQEMHVTIRLVDLHHPKRFVSFCLTKLKVDPLGQSCVQYL